MVLHLRPKPSLCQWCRRRRGSPQGNAPKRTPDLSARKEIHGATCKHRMCTPSGTYIQLVRETLRPQYSSVTNIGTVNAIRAPTIYLTCGLLALRKTSTFKALLAYMERSNCIIIDPIKRMTELTATVREALRKLLNACAVCVRVRRTM